MGVGGGLSKLEDRWWIIWDRGDRKWIYAFLCVGVTGESVVRVISEGGYLGTCCE